MAFVGWGGPPPPSNPGLGPPKYSGTATYGNGAYIELTDSAFGFTYAFDTEVQQSNCTEVYQVWDHKNWTAATTLGHNAGNIEMFPCMTWPAHSNYTNTGVPVGNISSLQVSCGFQPATINTSTYSGSIDSVIDWDMMFDIWIDCTPTGGGTYTAGVELMVWLNWSKGWTMPYPYGSTHGTTTITGTNLSNPTAAESWYYWTNGTPTSAGTGTIAVAVGTPVFSRSLDLAPILAWCVSHGYFASNDILQTVEWGIEVSATNSTPMTFTATDFTVGVFTHS